jgi:hypothetical protein
MQQLGLLQGQGKTVGFNLKPFDSLKIRRRVTRLLELFVAAAGMYWGDCSFLPQRRDSTWSYLLPSMIDTLGFNTEESQILEGYCDKAVDSTAPSPPAAHHL